MSEGTVEQPSGEVAPPRVGEPVAGPGKGRTHDLQFGALGLLGVVLLALAGAGPTAGVLANVPIGVGLGNGPYMPGGLIVVTVMLLLFSVGYGEMARKLNGAGGFYNFISHGIGRPAGLAAGWSALAGYSLVEVAVYGGFGYFAANTASSLLGINLSWVVWAFAALILCGALSYVDVKLSAKVLGVGMALDVVVIMVFSLVVLIKGGPHGSGTPVAPLSPVKAFTGIAPGVGIFFAFWSFLGFEVVPNYAEESSDPQKHSSRGLYVTVLVVGVVYVIGAWAGVVGHGVSGASAAAAKDPVNFIYTLSTSYIGNWYTDVLKVLVLVSLFATCLAFHHTTCRYFFALGRERVLPARLGHTHPRYRSPYVAVVVQTVICAVVIGAFIGFWYISPPAQKFSGTFAAAPYFELFGWLAILTTFWVIFNEVLSSVATIVYFQRGELRPELSIWKHIVAPLLGGAGMAYALYLLWSNLTTVGGNIIFVKLIPWLCVAWFLIGLAWALWIRARRPHKYAVLGQLVNRGVAAAEGEA